MELGWSLLGGLDAIVDGEQVSPRGRPAQVLAVLLLRRNRLVPLEDLIDQLWPDDPPGTARNSIQRFVADLRKELGPARERLVTEAAGYRLRVEEGELDLDRVENELAAVRSLDPARSTQSTEAADAFASLSMVGEALARPLCPGMAPVDLVDRERVRLAALRVTTLEMAGDTAVDAGLDATDRLVQWADEYPLNERLTAQLVRVLARRGRQAEALAAIERLRSGLRDELGVSLSPSVASLELDVLQQRETMEAVGRATPPGVRPLIGRDDELAVVARALEDNRLVTLSGPGGVGKTSLALAVTHLDPVAPLGPTHVAILGDVTSPALLVDTVAAAVGVELLERGVDEIAAQTVRQLAAEACVLVLDNAEHIIDHVAEFVSEVLAQPGACRILVTSREPLAVAGERVIQVQPLPVEKAAVELFAIRSAEVGGPDRGQLVEDPLAAVICRALDGLPLAIELAAAQLSVVTLDELAARIGRPTRLLRGRRAPLRQSSLEALLDWSWDLLSEDERGLLAELSVFNEWPLEAVEYLEPERGFSVLSGLVAKSLVQVGVGADGRSRYRLLETVRDYAREQLDRRDGRAEAEARHADWVLAMARESSMAEALMQVEAHDQLDRELPNVLAALGWLMDHGCRRDLFDLTARAAGLFAHRGPLLEGSQWFDRVMSLLDGHDVDVDLRGAMLSASWGMAIARGDYIAMMMAGLDASALVTDDAPPYDWAPSILAMTAMGFEVATLDATSRHLLDRAEQVAPHTPSAALNQAVVAVFRGDFELANRRYASAIDHYRRAVAHDPAPGRALLLAESGLLTALHMLERHEEAAALADQVRSPADADAWHYFIEISRAVALGPDSPSRAARILEAVLGTTADDALPGRSEDVRIATAVVLWAAGDRTRCLELLESAIGRSPALMALLVEYLDAEPRRRLSTDEWGERWRSGIERRVAERPAGSDGWAWSDGPGSTERENLNAALRALSPE
ncbi:MAG: BTAD domain-containing putative transcriptional regulator [Actinomycetota bacterium]